MKTLRLLLIPLLIAFIASNILPDPIGIPAERSTRAKYKTLSDSFSPDPVCN